MVLLLVMFACSIYAPIGLRQDHLFFLLPIPQILLALAAFCGYHVLASPKTSWPRLVDAAAGAIFLSLLAAALLWHVFIIYRTEDRLRRTGGEGFLSDATFALSGWLEQHSITHPKVCDWGIHDPVQFLSKGRIRPKKCWRILGRDNFITNCLDGDNIYLFMAPDEVVNYPWASEIIRERGERLTAKKTFYRRDGAVAFVAYARQPL